MDPAAGAMRPSPSDLDHGGALARSSSCLADRRGARSGGGVMLPIFARARDLTAGFSSLALLALRRRLWRIKVDGNSMLPTLTPGQVVWCETAPSARRLREGDIVVFRVRANSQEVAQPEATEEIGIKRVQLLSADRDEASGTIRLTCELRGDNVAHSRDSRHFGRVPVEDVLARVVLPSRGRLRRLA